MVASPFANIPDDLLTAVALDATCDADHVGLFLSYLRIRGTPVRPIFLPREFLLQLAAALRLLCWEAQGFFFHRDAGLPDAQEAIRDAFRSLADHHEERTDISKKVLRLFIDRFAWNGQRDLGAAIALDDLADDAALDALAEFFWAVRHAGCATDDNLS